MMLNSTSTLDLFIFLSNFTHGRFLASDLFFISSLISSLLRPYFLQPTKRAHHILAYHNNQCQPTPFLSHKTRSTDRLVDAGTRSQVSLRKSNRHAADAGSSFN